MIQFVMGKITFFMLVVAVSSLEYDASNHWLAFKTHFNKTYSSQEQQIRRRIFEDNLVFIMNHNIEEDMGMHSYRLGITVMTDLTHKEYLDKYTCIKDINNEAKDVWMSPPLTKLPKNLDYRKMGMVTEVKDQKNCGSCYAFVVISTIETTWAFMKGQLISLSEQNVVDCSRKEGNKGCEYGNLVSSYNYLMNNPALDTEKDYPYKAKEGPCHHIKNDSKVAIRGFGKVRSNSSRDLQDTLAKKGAVSIVINAGLPTMRSYKSGIYGDPNCDDHSTHGMTIVGYGTENKIDYWILKNSWGEKWGEKGFLRIRRGKDNLCGVLKQPFFPFV